MSGSRGKNTEIIGSVPTSWKRPVSDRYAAMLEQAMPDDVCKAMRLPKGTSWGDGICMAEMREAIGATKRGNTVQARKNVREAIEGKAPQRLELIGPEDREFTMRVTYREAPQTNKKIREVNEGPQKVLDVPKEEAKTP